MNFLTKVILLSSITVILVDVDGSTLARYQYSFRKLAPDEISSENLWLPPSESITFKNCGKLTPFYSLIAENNLLCASDKFNDVADIYILIEYKVGFDLYKKKGAI